MKWRHRCKKWLTFGSGNLLDVLILIILSKKQSYGYSLIEEIGKLGINISFLHPAIVYRNLRNLELEGLVISNWEIGTSGPARRVYRITEDGKKYLENWYIHAKNDFMIIKNIIEEIEKILEKK